MDSLPFEMLDIIAKMDVQAYHALVLSMPEFARRINSSTFQEYFTVVEDILVERDSEWQCSLLNEYGAQYLQGTVSYIRGQNTKKIDADGVEIWLKNNVPHRLDGPAIIGAFGYEEWRVEGKLHRLNAPAFVSLHRNVKWYNNGLLHRLDGPAIVYRIGYEEWYKDGQLHRLDGPALTGADGSEAWFKDGQLHRLDGPAKTDTQGNLYWYCEGLLHRIGGPAVIRANCRAEADKNEWWIHGSQHSINTYVMKTVPKGRKPRRRPGWWLS